MKTIQSKKRKLCKTSESDKDQVSSDASSILSYFKNLHHGSHDSFIVQGKLLNYFNRHWDLLSKLNLYLECNRIEYGNQHYVNELFYDGHFLGEKLKYSTQYLKHESCKSRIKKNV